MLTGKQRSYLRGLANDLDPIVMIGKAGLTETVKEEIDRALENRELVKVKIQEGSDLECKAAANEIAYYLKCDYVQSIGRRFTVYRKAKDPDKRKIVLPK
ncbi:MAG: YhbY family RNA-binding protein [Eubacteriaceae bacterium]|jgi:RNA-binding protein|nr:YhbY family RNA-binding protein [Eubacteriaceae bacterium]